MDLVIDVLLGRRVERVRSSGDRVTVGKSSVNDIALTDDNLVSQLHLSFERFAAGWCVTDLGSSNGTWLNSERIWSPRRLRKDDEVRVGQTRLVVREAGDPAAEQTQIDDPPPPITTRERDVLVALCRPLLARDMFTEPASTRAIAEDLVITQAAVKQHLTNLYDKFSIAADDASRRVRLANDALRRGVVSIADLHPPTRP